jgi:malonyl-CoA/methylmalonyl-CoA synthetase
VYAFTHLIRAADAVSGSLLAQADDLSEEPIPFLVAPGFEYVAAQWGIWNAGGIAVPLPTSHPPAELDYVLGDAGARVAITDSHYRERLQPLCQRRELRLLDISVLRDGSARRTVFPAEGRAALMLYTSGTTARPKGVVLTHDNLKAQVETLLQAWEWSQDDRALLVLPLHHVHGIVNVLSCALWSGARCVVRLPFDAGATWNALSTERITVFMAVPTIYRRLIETWNAADEDQRAEWSAAARGLRLMVSGSAALPVSVLEQWKHITGHTLLERYGMTEIGMALSNSLHGERRAGHVGRPLPGVEVRVVDDRGADVAEGTAGELLVRGPAVFREYWRRPEATRDAFRDGWFATGDVVQVHDGMFRIVGRRSVDIIKTGGYKVSALEIEEVLRTHPAVAECAVVGVDDDEWGQRVCLAYEPRGNERPDGDAIRTWGRDRLAAYKLPREVLPVTRLPRNAMGKVMKPDVVKLFDRARVADRTGDP